MKLVFLFVSLMAVVSCGRKSGNTTHVGSAYGTAGGAGVVGGSVHILQSCGQGPAQVQIGDTNRTLVSTQQVPNGGTFSFQVAPGSYHLYASASNVCSVSTNQPVASGYSAYRICLGDSNQCRSSGYAKMSLKMGAETEKPAEGIKSFCEWKSWGCSAEGFVGSGDALVESSILITSKKALDVGFDLEYKSGNDWIFAMPAFENKGWKISLAAGAAPKIADLAYDNLFVKSQVNRSSFQFTNGFCGTRAQLPIQIAEYAKLNGFSDVASNRLSAHALRTLPDSSELCAYPQEEAQIDQTVIAKSTKPVEIRRLWFVLSPKLTAAQARNKEFKGPAKPAQNALLEARKSKSTRSIANETEASIEDLGLGFLVQK